MLYYWITCNFCLFQADCNLIDLVLGVNNSWQLVPCIFVIRVGSIVFNSKRDINQVLMYDVFFFLAYFVY
jgi:hypothetical protein